MYLKGCTPQDVMLVSHKKDYNTATQEIKDGKSICHLDVDKNTLSLPSRGKIRNMLIKGRQNKEAASMKVTFFRWNTYFIFLCFIIS